MCYFINSSWTVVVGALIMCLCLGALPSFHEVGRGEGRAASLFLFCVCALWKETVFMFLNSKDVDVEMHPFQHSAVQVLYIGMQSMCNKDSLEGATADQV